MPNLKSHPLEKAVKELREYMEKETKKKTGERYWSWLKHIDAWNLFWPSKGELLELSHELENSLVYARFGEIQFHLITAHIAISIGAYHLLLRELRYILESALQAYYLDTTHPNAGIECKLEILVEVERQLYGTRLIKKIEIENKQNLVKIYSELSQYVHSSSSELKDILEKLPTFWFPFNEELFQKCLEFTNKVMDVIFLLFLKRFQQLIFKVIKNKQELTEYSLLTEFLNRGKSS